jgi:retron-type reverse transcriptase
MSYQLSLQRPKIDAHQGEYPEFLNRYEMEVMAIAERNPHELKQFHADLFNRITDERNLRIAWDSLAARGGTAPGPNGARYENFTDLEVWHIVRRLRDTLREGNYEVGPVRKVKVSKGPNRGTRTIALMNIEERVVHRGIVQIAQPVIDPLFDDLSFGGRPHRNPWHALLSAQRLTNLIDAGVWITEDIKGAFDHVPLGRLLDLVRHQFEDPAFCDLIRRAVGFPKRRKGLRQGSPLSPLLTNLYLDAFLDRKWRQAHPDVPLLRYVDDILLLCPPGSDPSNLCAELRALLQPAGMTLKGDAVNAIRDLGSGQSAIWLGYEIGLSEAGMSVRVPDSAETRIWPDRLRKMFMQAHAASNSPLRARQAIDGLLQYFGPAYRNSDRRGTYRVIKAIAHEYAFEEMPSKDEFLAVWRSGYRRFERLRRLQNRA